MYPAIILIGILIVLFVKLTHQKFIYINILQVTSEGDDDRKQKLLDFFQS